MKKKVMALVLLFVGLFLISEQAEAAKIDLPINTITGSVYQDINENGVMELKNFEVTVANQEIHLYGSLADAQQNQNVLKTTKTNSVGIFSFTKLKRGTYFVKYNFDPQYRAISFAQNPLVQEQTQAVGIAQVDVTNTSKLLYTVNLPQKRVTNLEIIPFEDNNWNGLLDPEESVMNGKTMIILNLRRFAEMLENDELAGLDTSKLISTALGGSIDISDGIFFRTTKNGKIINMPDVKSDMYIIIRSPFDLTLSSMLGNLNKINALLQILQGGDVTALLNDPDLIATNDLDTNSENEYIKLLASIVPKIADEIDKINYNEIIGENNAATVSKTVSQLRSLGRLLDNIPGLRFAKVDYFGHVYDLTGLKINRTNQFLFGIKQYGTLSGYVYHDANLNGQKDASEKLRAVDLTAYDAQGNVLSTVRSSATYGEYKLNHLPYGQPIYLGVPNDVKTSSELLDGKPASLADKKIIGRYYFEKTATVRIIKQDIAVIE